MQKHHDNARIFTALGDVTRLGVLDFLKNGEKSATAIQEHLGVGQSTVSHHMKILTESGLVTGRKVGKWTHYSVNVDGSRYAVRLLRLLTAPAPKNPRSVQIMKPFTIVADSACDFPVGFAEKHNIQHIPIPCTLDDKEYRHVSDKEFYAALKGGSVAKTSMINPEMFVRSFAPYAESGEDVLYILLSSGLSGTHQSAVLALDEIREKHPDCGIYLVDSLAATALGTLLVQFAVQKRDEGLSAAETAAFLDEKKHRLLGIFTVDDLMHLHRGGRLGKMAAIGGSLLGIKPVLTILPNGTLELKEKARGRMAALKLMVSQMVARVNPDAELETVYISHSDSEDSAKKLADLVKAAVKVKKVEIVGLGPVIGAHVGPGAVTLIFEGALTREECEKKFYGGSR